MCDGRCASCPADKFLSSTTVCRPAAGACDVAETCSGANATCPCNDHVKAAGTVCRASAGVCDVAEVCDGLAVSCPADSFKSSRSTCRASAGVCDVAETCSGTNATCPADAFAAPTTLCRAQEYSSDGSTCDVAEYCTGRSVSCPADGFAAVNTACRLAAGPCDLGAKCSGSSSVCPAGTFKPATTMCRPSSIGSDGTSCDAAEYCNGKDAACPCDVNLAAGTACIGGVAYQGVPPTCNGNSSKCPSQPVYVWNDDSDNSSSECYSCGLPSGNPSTCTTVKSLGKYPDCITKPVCNASNHGKLSGAVVFPNGTVTWNVYQSSSTCNLTNESPKFHSYAATWCSERGDTSFGPSPPSSQLSSAQVTNQTTSSNAQTAGSSNMAQNAESTSNTKWILVGVLTTVGVVTIFAIQWAVRHVRRLKQQTTASAKVAPMHWDDPNRPRVMTNSSNVNRNHADDLYLEDA